MGAGVRVGIAIVTPTFLLRSMGSGGARSGVFAGVGPIGILAVTLRCGGGGGGGCRVAEASGGLTGCGLSRDRLALRAANESSNSCGDGKGWVPDALLVAVEAGDGRMQPKSCCCSRPYS